MRTLLGWPETVSRRSTGLFAVTSALLAAFVVFVVSEQPLYTDVYYHLNAANRLLSGQGLSDAYLWNYVNPPAALSGDWSVPSHQYWMPATTLLAAAGMAITGAHGSYAAGQIGFALAAWGLALIGFAVGARLGRTALLAWVAGLLTILSPFYAISWGAIDSTTPFAVTGAACLLVLGGLCAGSRFDRRAGWWWLAAGALAALSHLARPDGLVLLGVGGLTALIVAWRNRAWRAVWLFMPLLLGYLLVMAPWFARNQAALGTVLPSGGLEGAFYTEYDDLFAYPPNASLARFLDTLGPGGFVSTRLAALFGNDGGVISGNFGTWLAVEGMIFLAPLMVIGLFRRWRDPFLWPFVLGALAIHAVMTLIFPFAGYRGGLLHSAGALVPFWAALGVVGLGDVVGWVSKRRRTWNARTATSVFAVGLVALAVLLLALLAVRPARTLPDGERTLYAQANAALPSGARVFTADPPAFYYHTGRGGAVLPNSPPETLQTLSAQYDIGYALLTENGLPGGLVEPLGRHAAIPNGNPARVGRRAVVCDRSVSGGGCRMP